MLVLLLSVSVSLQYSIISPRLMYSLDQKQLVRYLVFSGALRTPAIIAAFKRVDRADFVPEEYRSEAYEDYPLPIGFGQTISQPTTVAFMIELLDPRPGHIVLDIGAGSGWTSAILASLVGNAGYVTGTEVLPELVTYGRKNLAKYPFLNVSIIQARQELGIARNRFDRILVSAGATRFPDELLDQLSPEGKMVIPVGDSLFLCEKDAEGHVSSRRFA